MIKQCSKPGELQHVRCSGGTKVWEQLGYKERPCLKKNFLNTQLLFQKLKLWYHKKEHLPYLLCKNLRQCIMYRRHNMLTLSLSLPTGITDLSWQLSHFYTYWLSPSFLWSKLVLHDLYSTFSCYTGLNSSACFLPFPLYYKTCLIYHPILCLAFYKLMNVHYIVCQWILWRIR